MNRKDFIAKWVELFNQGNATELADLYHEEAINHQVAYQPVKGKVAIKEMFEKEFEKVEMVCIVESIFEDGEWAILEWKDPLGLKGCGFFYINDGKIKLQRGYWDQLSFLRQHNLPLPKK